MIKNDQYQTIISPGELQTAHSDLLDSKSQMVTIRIQDNFENGQMGAEWKVFEQYEINLFPLRVNITQKFYEKFKRFCVPSKVNLQSVGNLQNPYAVSIKPDKEAEEVGLEKTKEKEKFEFPSYYTYLRINQIHTTLSYFKNKKSWKVLSGLTIYIIYIYIYI